MTDLLTDAIPAHISLPIDFQNEKRVKCIKDTMRIDLELGDDISGNILAPIYTRSESSTISKTLIQKLTAKYSTCPEYLRDTQEFLRRLRTLPTLLTEKTTEVGSASPQSPSQPSSLDTMNAEWSKFKSHRNFLEKFQYVEWQRLQFLNKSPVILQAMTYYNMSSPLMSIILPIIGMLIPFWVMRTTSGVSFSLTSYLTILTRQFGGHPLGKALRGVMTGDMEGIVYAIVIAAFYGIALYQNVMSCWRFYQNLSYIHATLISVKEHLEATQEVLDQLIQACEGGVGGGDCDGDGSSGETDTQTDAAVQSPLSTYEKYAAYLTERYDSIGEILEEIGDVSPWSLTFGNVMRVGHRLHSFYRLYHDSAVHDTILFSLGVCGYYEAMRCICDHLDGGRLALCVFTVDENLHSLREGENPASSDSSGNKTELVDMIYPAFIGDNSCHNTEQISPVSNTISLSKPLVITGPNASGKTTILKSVMLNMLLSQSIGAGCYREARVECFDELHSYINIPDTSGRDSLFQAEARRCKQMLDSIQSDETKQHLCVFDELYSGTNPYEARITARTLLKYLSNRRTSFILTTHFYDLCEDLSAVGIPMMKMESEMRITQERTREKYREEEHEEEEHEEEEEENENEKREENTPSKNTPSKYSIIHSYKLVPGMSRIQGGISVLEELGYPSEMVDEAWSSSIASSTETFQV